MTPDLGPTVALLGRVGVTMDAVARHLADAGATVSHAVIPGVTEAVVVIEPTDAEWTDLAKHDTPVIAIVDDSTEQVVLDAMAAGANAVVSTADHPYQLVTAVRQVCGGEILLSQQMAQVVLLRLREQQAPQEPAVSLTAREDQILRSIAAGDGVKQTARALGIQEKTVQNLQSRLFRKLGASNRVHCITRAHELHLLA